MLRLSRVATEEDKVKSQIYTEIVRSTKTEKTPRISAETYDPTSGSSCLVPKSELLPRLEVQYGFVPKLS